MSDNFDYTKPPKNVFGVPDLCPDCGGLGFVRGPHGQYDYRDCPNRLCNNGKLNIAEETLVAVEAEIDKIVESGRFELEHELAKRTGVNWKKIATIREAKRNAGGVL